MVNLIDVTFSYGQLTALRGISTQIKPGIHLLLGENGAGKTTLLHVVAGLLRPQHGACMIGNDNIADRMPADLAYVFYIGDDITLPARTINELRRIHAPFYPTFDQEMLYKNLEAFGLNGNERLDKQSMGNRRKSYIAYALALRVPVLLLDEPANGLDITSKDILRSMLMRCVSEEQTVIVSTHTVWELKNIFDGLLVMSRGELLLSMPTWEITSRIKFVTGMMPEIHALYSANEIGAYHSMVANTDNQDSEVNFHLLYTGLMSEARNKILDTLNSKT